MDNKLIITGASQAYGPSLLALLGSINLNWSNHPPVLVYDIGLDETTLEILRQNEIPVRQVPPFCPHWRKHFTWKIWCWNDAPAEQILWMDAGAAVLQPMDELFQMIDRFGYAVFPNYHSLEKEASEMACRGCGVEPQFRQGKVSVLGGLIGFKKTGIIERMLQEALSVALVEENIRATEYTHRHDQAIISLLLYKHLSNPILLDGRVYAGWTSPFEVPGQKHWTCRRRMVLEDLDFLAQHISGPGEPYMPRIPPSPRVSRADLLKAWLKKNLQYYIYRFRTKILGQKVPAQPSKVYDGDLD
jgi:hypothetical protein